MECSLYALIACFSWSGLYIDGDLNYQDSSVPYFYWKDTSPPPRDGIIETSAVSAIGHDSNNPYGRVAIGYQLDFNKITLSIEASHTSSIESDTDRGVNAITLSARWFPFH
jgi:hypothetical protein